LSTNHPYFVGSRTSGVDGSSEGGRLSTVRLPTTLALYSVPLLQSIRRSDYAGKVNAEPAQVDGKWVLRVTYDGEQAPEVPERWHGHRVVVEQSRPANG